MLILQDQSKALQESVQNNEHLENRIQSLEEMTRNGEDVNKVNVFVANLRVRCFCFAA